LTADSLRGGEHADEPTGERASTGVSVLGPSSTPQSAHKARTLPINGPEGAAVGADHPLVDQQAFTVIEQGFHGFRPSTVSRSAGVAMPRTARRDGALGEAGDHRALPDLEEGGGAEGGHVSIEVRQRTDVHARELARRRRRRRLELPSWFGRRGGGAEGDRREPSTSDGCAVHQRRVERAAHVERRRATPISFAC
jgi:hypothetical protein